MAFNKGLQLNDANTVVRDSITLGGQDQAFLQTQSVGGSAQSHGAVVFTIRPSDNDDSAGAYQSLLHGQNFVIGLEYNTAGDQYRVVVQSREAYDTGGAGVGAGTVTPAYGNFVSTEVETTFGLNLNDNGTLTYMENGSGAQVLSIPSFTPQTASVVVDEVAAPATANDDTAHFLMDDGRGNIIEIEATAAGTNAGDLVSAIKSDFDSLSTDQQSGFEISAVANTDEITISRTDGAGFLITPLDNHHTASIQNNGGADLDAADIDLRDYGTDFFSRDFDGFVSQVATFNQPLTISELSGYVNQPNTIPETLVNSDGRDSTAIITFEQGAPQTTAGKIYEIDLDDRRGNTIEVSYTTASTADTFAQFAADIKADFNALDDTGGFSFDDSVANQITFSRTDGVDFEVASGAASTYANTDDLVVNGTQLGMATGETYTSTSLVNATITLAEESALTDSSLRGKTYEIILDDGTGGDDTATVSFFLPSGSTTADDALSGLLTEFGGAGTASDGYVFSAVSSNEITITRSDGQNFDIKLGAGDEASNLTADGTALTKDSVVSSTDGVRSGVPDTISNKVVQNFDFTNLSDSEEVVSKASDNYSSAATLKIYGMDKSVGPHASTLAALGTSNGYDGVDSTGYTGSVVVSSGDKIASDVLFTQIREAADSGNANRQITVDIFVDPYLVTDGDFGAISYNVGWDAALTIESLVQLDSTGGYKLADIDVANDSADVRWFKPTPGTDFSTPIATMVLTDTAGSTDPTFTFTSVDIDGVDFTDDVTYTTSFTDTLDADLWDLGDNLVNGNDSTTDAADQLVIVSGAPGGSASAPAPTSGLYLKLDSYDQDAGTDNPNVDYRLGVYSSTATNTVSFEIDLPALADTAVDPVTLVNNTNFVLDAALTDWALTTAEVRGRTLVVEASGATNLAVGDSVGQFSTSITNGFDTTQYFDMVNVQTDADSANENGRGLYVAATRTEADGDWVVNDMPTGIMTRAFVGTADIAPNSVTALDAYYALQMSAGLQPNWWGGSFQEGQALAADFDGSGKITAADALAILQYSVGTIPTPDPVNWVFFDSETSGITNANNVDEIAALAENTAVTASNLTLGQGDEVILVGNLSDPAA